MNPAKKGLETTEIQEIEKNLRNTYDHSNPKALKTDRDREKKLQYGQKHHTEEEEMENSWLDLHEGQEQGPSFQQNILVGECRLWR